MLDSTGNSADNVTAVRSTFSLYRSQNCNAKRMHTFNSTHARTNIELNTKVELASDTVIYRGRYAILCHKTTLSADATLHASLFFSPTRKPQLRLPKPCKHKHAQLAKVAIRCKSTASNTAKGYVITYKATQTLVRARN